MQLYEYAERIVQSKSDLSEFIFYLKLGQYLGKLPVYSHQVGKFQNIIWKCYFVIIKTIILILNFSAVQITVQACYCSKLCFFNLVYLCNWLLLDTIGLYNVFYHQQRWLDLIKYVFQIHQLFPKDKLHSFYKAYLTTICLAIFANLLFFGRYYIFAKLDIGLIFFTYFLLEFNVLHFSVYLAHTLLVILYRRYSLYLTDMENLLFKVTFLKHKCVYKQILHDINSKYKIIFHTVCKCNEIFGTLFVFVLMNMFICLLKICSSVVKLAQDANYHDLIPAALESILAIVSIG